MTVPNTPCPTGGLVPWEGGIWPIASSKPHPVFIWVYVIHVKRKDGPLVIWANVSQEEIVRGMAQVARFAVNSTVELGPFKRRTITARKWDFQRGMMCYRLAGDRPGRDHAMFETDLLERIKAAEEGVR